MQIYNTLTRKKEELVPMTAGHMGIYACGPTVYNYIHIGNARPICAFDVLRRYLKYRGYTVTYVQNFTDVDDKIIKKANEEGTTAAEIAKRYIAEYKTDAHGLNVMDADVHPTVTNCMDLIIDIVKKLVDSGHAYAAANGDVYFRTSSFPEYGKLSGQPIEELQAGARIECHQHKLHVVCVDKVNIGNAALFVRNQVFQGCGLASFDDVVQDSILLFQNNFSIDHTDIRAGSTQCFGRNSQKIILRKGNCPAIFA